MNPVKLKFRHGGEMLVFPIGLRFVEDPDHGPLVLIPEAQGPKAYQLDMTLEEAEQTYRNVASQELPLMPIAATQGHHARKIEGIEEQLVSLRSRYTCLLEQLGIKPGDENLVKPDLPTLHDLGPQVRQLEARTRHVVTEIRDFVLPRIDVCQAENINKWQALAIHLGLPEGWEHLHEGAAEVKGALVSQAEEIEALRDELNLIKEQNDDFTLAERVGELEEARRNQRRRFDEDQEASDKMFKALRSATTRLREDYNKLDYAIVETARWCGSLEQRLATVEKELSLPKEEASLFTLAERVGELEESRRAAFQRLCDAELRLHSLEDRHRQMTNEVEGFRRDVENDRVCVQRQSIHPHLPSHWSAAKPKSAWKPLTGEERTPGQKVLIRLAGTPRMMWIAVPSPAGYSVGTDVRWTLELDRFDGYEFCPIPE